ncbi:MAG: hypothetical protein WD358_03220 [Nitriliruptoraceae bacterium]
MSDAQGIGANLRRVRRDLGWSLADVERNSEGSFTAVVVGSYERGDRNITAVRMLELAGLYGLTPAQVLDAAASATTAIAPVGEDAVTLDLERLRLLAAGEEAWRDVDRFASSVIARRGDFNGAWLSVREEDIQTLAAARSSSSAQMLAELVDAGIVRLD